MHKMMMIIMARACKFKKEMCEHAANVYENTQSKTKVVKSVYGNEERIGMLCDFALSVIKYMLSREFFV